jgi:prevent-host-death family protein
MSAKPIPVHAAKTNLSRLIERACAGEEIVIARGKTPVVRLVPVTSTPPKRQFGAMKGRARVGAAFFEPLPEKELDAWGS